MVIATPSDEQACRDLLTTAYQHKGPAAVRYPRGSGAGVPLSTGLDVLPLGKGVLVRDSREPSDSGAIRTADTVAAGRIAILGFGTLVCTARNVADELDLTLADMRFVKPLDEALVLELARTHDALVTIEDGCIMGGAGSAVIECLQAAGVDIPVLQLGLPDRFIDHGDPGLLMSLEGLDAEGIHNSIVKRFEGILSRKSGQDVGSTGGVVRHIAASLHFERRK